MAIPLAAILSAAPGVISAASEVIRMIKQKKGDNNEPSASEDEKLRDVVNLIEKQAQVIEELAQANQQLALAVRNNRIITLLSLGIAVISIGIAGLL
ncbi:MAG: hypothetical protein OEX12_06345 [Gammaproteobacteria bacterium]|nr:hypothetical protein [Gammaproteobacteria bacterium]